MNNKIWGLTRLVNMKKNKDGQGYPTCEEPVVLSTV